MIMNKNTIEFLRGNHESKLVELEDKFSSINLVLKNVVKGLISDTQELQKKRKYDEVLKLVEIQKSINESIQNNSSLIKDLKVEKEPKPKERRKSGRRTKAPVTNINEYNKYEVDTEEPHSLEEDFRFKRPHAFSIGSHYSASGTWKEMLIRTCDYLFKLDPDKFRAFAEGDEMQWGETHNFSTNKELIREPQLISGSGVYVEIAKGSIGARQLIIKMLESYGIETSEYKVYLRADYSEKREQDENYRRRQSKK